MLVRCILMRGRRRVRETRDVSLSIVLAVADDLALHAHPSSVVRVHLAGWTPGRRHALAHFEQGVHLLVGAHLVPKNRVGAHGVVPGLVDV